MSSLLDRDAISVASLEKVSWRDSKVMSTLTSSFLPWPALYLATTFDIASPSGPGHSTIFTVPFPLPAPPEDPPLPGAQPDTASVEPSSAASSARARIRMLPSIGTCHWEDHTRDNAPCAMVCHRLVLMNLRSWPSPLARLLTAVVHREDRNCARPVEAATQAGLPDHR